jgi:hypothetical protein
VDEVTPSGVLTGAVWNFTTATTPPPTNAVYEWSFDNGLSAALGRGTMEYADNATANITAFGTTDGAGVPHIGGRPATYMRVPRFTNDVANGYVLSFDDSGANGGGAYINRFTFIADVLVPGPIGWTALFNTNPENAKRCRLVLRQYGEAW